MQTKNMVKVYGLFWGVKEGCAEPLELTRGALRDAKAPARPKGEERRFEAEGKASTKAWDKEFG